MHCTRLPLLTLLTALMLLPANRVALLTPVKASTEVDACEVVTLEVAAPRAAAGAMVAAAATQEAMISPERLSTKPIVERREGNEDTKKDMKTCIRWLPT